MDGLTYIRLCIVFYGDHLAHKSHCLFRGKQGSKLMGCQPISFWFAVPHYAMHSPRENFNTWNPIDNFVSSWDPRTILSTNQILVHMYFDQSGLKGSVLSDWLSFIGNGKMVSVCPIGIFLGFLFWAVNEKNVSLCHSYSWRSHLCELHNVLITHLHPQLLLMLAFFSGKFVRHGINFMGLS